MIEIKCVMCPTLFTPVGKQLTCSPECSKKYQRKLARDLQRLKRKDPAYRKREKAKLNTPESRARRAAYQHKKYLERKEAKRKERESNE